MGTLAEELGAALDGVELPSGETTEPQPTEGVEPEPVVTDTGRDEQGRFVAKQPEAGTQEPAAPLPEPAKVEQQPADARSLVTPPATWSASGKAIFAQLPEAARKEIAKREQDYARGIQQHAEAARGYQTLMREFQPYEALIRSEGGTPQGVIRDLMNTAYLLRSGSPQDRGNVVMQIIKRFGADITPFIGQPAQQQEGQDLSQVQQLVQQLVSPHLQKIQDWERSQTTAKQQQEQHMEQEIQSQIEAFQSATNEDGTPKHLYFENVRPLMSAYFANGQAKSLEQAYDMACWANPEVRAALIAEKQRTEDAQRLAEAKRRAGNARDAGFNVSGQGGVGIAGATQTSLRDDIASQLDAAMGGGRV